MQRRLTERELCIAEAWFDPVCCAEALIPENIKAPQRWPNCKKLTYRPYQFAIIDYSLMYADDPDKTKQDNFQMKVGAGTCYDIMGRNLGKSYQEVINSFLTVLHEDGTEACVSSFDFDHLKKICKPILNLANFHPIFDFFKRKDNKGGITLSQGGMEINTLRGHVTYGKNEKIADPDPGQGFHSLHASKWTIEEFSYASSKGEEKRVDAINSLGCIERFSGIPDSRLGSPLGDVLNDKKKKPWICRLPQFVREDFTEITLANQTKKYKGRNSPAFRLNVLAEYIPGAEGYFDWERICEHSYRPKEKIKFFEVGKKDFEKISHLLKDEAYWPKFLDILKTRLVVDNVPGRLKIIASDIGTTGSASNICLFFGNHKLLKWKYLIPLVDLTTQEQSRIFKYIYDKLDGAIIALDSTNADGRSILDDLRSFGIPEEHLVECNLGKKIIVGFKEDGKGKVLVDEKFRPIIREEEALEWANSELEIVYYNGLVEIPYEETFVHEVQSYFCTKVGNRLKFGSSSTNHILQSHQCMALARFFNEKVKEKTSGDNDYLGGF